MVRVTARDCTGAAVVCTTATGGVEGRAVGTVVGVGVGGGVGCVGMEVLASGSNVGGANVATTVGNNDNDTAIGALLLALEEATTGDSVERLVAVEDDVAMGCTSGAESVLLLS